MKEQKNSTTLAATGYVPVAAYCLGLVLMCLLLWAPRAEASTRLSNETTLSRWAYTNEIVKVKTRPGAGRTITRTRWQTEDRLPELYLALKGVRENGRVYVKIRLPRRPNNSTGWIARIGIGNYHKVRTQLVINRSKFRATLYKSGRAIFSTRVAIGKAGSETPRGHFYVRERLAGFGNPVYGPFVFALSAYSPGLSDWPGGGIVGIHGTNQPGLVPGRVSHGCIRMRNGAIRKLSRLMKLGSPVLIK